MVGRVNAGDEVPARLPFGGVVLVGTAQRLRWAALECPCRSGHRILLNLNGEREPYWTVGSRRPLTLTPSVDSVTPMKRCHFLLRNGRVTWVQDERRD